LEEVHGRLLLYGPEMMSARCAPDIDQYSHWAFNGILALRTKCATIRVLGL